MRHQNIEVAPSAAWRGGGALIMALAASSISMALSGAASSAAAASASKRGSYQRKRRMAWQYGSSISGIVAYGGGNIMAWHGKYQAAAVIVAWRIPANGISYGMA